MPAPDDLDPVLRRITGRTPVAWDPRDEGAYSADRGVVVVDWGGARRGNALVNHAGGEAAVRAAGGPPGLVLRDRPEWAAWLAGQAAWFLSEEPPGAMERLVETERREALAALRWAAEELGLPAPEPGEVFRRLGAWRP